MTAKPAVLVTRLLPRPVMDEIDRRFHLLAADPPEDLPDPHWLLESAAGAEGIISLLTEPIDRSVIDAAPPAASSRLTATPGRAASPAGGRT